MARTTRRSSRSALLLLPLAAITVVAAVTWFRGGSDTAPALGAVAPAATPAVAADAIAGSPERDTAPSSRGFWTAPAGSRFVHRVVDRCDFTIRSAEGGTQPGGALHAECLVETLVCDRRDDEILVRQTVHEPTFFLPDGRKVADDPIQASFVAATAAPVFVRLGTNGSVHAFAFATGLDGDQRNFLRGTLSLLAFEAPAAGSTSWTSRAADSTGEFDAKFEVRGAVDADEVHVERTRIRYVAVAGNAEVPKHELSGRGEATFALDRGWICAVRIDEHTTMSLPMLDLQALTHRRADVVLVESGMVEVPADVLDAWRRAVEPASGAAEAIGRYAAGNERRRWQQTLNGVGLGQLLTDIERLLAADPVDAKAVDDAFQRLQWLLKLDDAHAAALAEQLTTRQLGIEVARVALGALGAAGTTAAQNALTTVRSDASVAMPVREAATVACVQLDDPAPSLMQSLAADADGTSELQGSSMLVLGALAPKAKSALADGRSPVDKLLAMENDAAARGDLATWLLAVGNAAPPQTLSIVQRYAADANPAVRAAACVALRRVSDADAVPILSNATSDVDAAVRREALLELGRRPSPEARSAIEHMASHEVDVELRDRARRFLAAG
ncbi:MAG: HEAT repeat domain-containing protein [Planctomycetes bacterium]|nr:HEAT repeat domain-containing protein [Planctomycetota bacterium]